MQREDVDRLAWRAEMLAAPLTKGGEFEALRVHHEETAAALRALLAERDAAFAAGQEEMRERAAKAADENTFGGGAVAVAIRALPINPRPE